MDAFIGLLFWAAIAVAFVMMVKRTKAKARARQSTPPSASPSRPEPLSNAQRKKLGLPTTQTEATEPTRAIRTGWSRGEIAFTYEDSDGDITCRTVTVHSVTGTYIKGECHDRAAERTFRVDRILGDITDCDTGEILSARKWARQNQN
jgi:predicted DNA-binding transcriptional regulator YafY